MSASADIVIQHGLPHRLRDQAAHICYEAFAQKFGSILGERATAVAILRQHFDGQHALVAMQDDQLLGIAAINIGAGSLIHVPFSALRQHFGPLQAIWRTLLLALIKSQHKPNEVTIDALAVSAQARGKGVGTRLLNAVVELARARHLHTVRLDVVDTNPEAKRLYERFGFVTSTIIHAPFLSFMGFTGATNMIYDAFGESSPHPKSFSQPPLRG